MPASLPQIKSDNALPEAAAVVHPKAPWPVFKYRFFTLVWPSIGTPEADTGLKPVHFVVVDSLI